MAIMHGGKAGEVICKSLGLNPKKIRSLEIVLETNSAAYIKIEGWLDTQDITSLGDQFRQFTMREGDIPHFCNHELVLERYLPPDHHHNGVKCENYCPGGCTNHLVGEDHNELCKLI